MREFLHLASQQGIGTLQFFVTQQQMLDALGNLIDQGVCDMASAF